MGTNCASLVADLFLFCYERDSMLSLSDNNQTDVFESFKSISRYLDDLFNIDNPYFDQMVDQLYPTVAHHNTFPIRRVEVKTFTISSGTRAKIDDHLLTDQLPKRVFIGLVTNEALNGTLDTNPFFFQDFNLSKMDVTCDGHYVYGKPFEPRFGNDQYFRSFLSVYQALASQNQVQNGSIDYEDYKGGHCFALAPDQASDQSHLHPIKLEQSDWSFNLQHHSLLSSLYLACNEKKAFYF